VHLADFEHACNAPQWSPGGEWILFKERDSVLSTNVGVWRLYKIASDGGQEIRLTSAAALHEGPHWSPDGTWIVYEYRKPIVGGYSQIYRVSASGGEEIALTSDSSTHESPRWAPDGSWITYERRGPPYQRRQIYRIHRIGGDEIPVTANDYSNHYRPRWSPDGKWIAYIRYDENRKLQIYKSSVSSTIIEHDKDIPSKIALEQNYPNPFNALTTIRFQLQETGHVTIKIYTALGHRIRTLLDLKKPPGNYSVSWNGKDDTGKTVASGIYIYQMKTGEFLQKRKLVILK